MSYDLSQLRLDGIKIGRIIDCKICQIPGEHGEMSLTAYAEEDTFDAVRSLEPLALRRQGEREENLFCGVLAEMTEEESGGLIQVHIIAKGYTYLMDIQKKSRTFQDVSMTYSELLRQIIGEYSDSDCIVSMSERPIGSLVVQYQETDWQFLKRLFSTIYMPLTGEIRIPAIRIYAGVPELESNQREYELKEMAMDYKQCAVWREMGCEVREADGLYCLVETEKPYGIFTSFLFRERTMVAEKIHIDCHMGFLRTIIGLKKKEGIIEPPQFPMMLVGLALEGTVLEAKGETVRLHFSIDDGRPSSDVYWFPYSTPSASPDGSGWYYMPEEGDCLRVYFPTKYMKDVLAISAVSNYKGEAGSDRMADPGTKYLRSASGQEMNMGGSGIYLASAGGAASLKVGNDGKIVVKGNQVEITATESIDIVDAANINFHSAAGALYKSSQGGTAMLDTTGNLIISGSQLKID